MQENYQQLAAALHERITIIADEASRRDEAHHMARLQTISETIERLGHSLPEPVNPQLRHFLQRRSYSKALELLETP